ncbi:MAG: hypothetical protein RBG1_1C00001G0360 [candidate division Zixibacteria bacterium RBG-1]|nr:MAG: hypothetical protein RBG1_1C00001G0360 [candidate division Zixibacteria bacterium RBG-1]OGC85506.1 MAG: hypothetical protein A2V73_06440 [candidate division Zixibacteria bacterium RBG_19FT_COMBO_42_43]
MGSFKKRFFKTIRRQFLSGVLVIVPIILTFIVLRFLFRSVDNLLSPVIAQIIGREIPGLGILATIVIIFIAGILTTYLGRSRLFNIWEIFFIKTPIVRTIYSASKQLMEGIALPDKKAFQQVVLVQYPREGIYNLGFVANRIENQLVEQSKELIVVFIPSTPTPFTGFVALFPKDQVIPLELTIEEGIKYFVSGGIASPKKLVPKEN